jgi:hypothetical protein
LETFGIAHGDLQHGNIIVKNDKLYLIDYDGMYFSELASLKTNEIGHINYQHPKRSNLHYNQYIDRFSALVIYIGLKAISINKNLWKKYDNSENILFKSQDFADLQNSPLIHDLTAIPEIRLLIERLIGCCYLEFEKIPSLKDFLAGNFNYDKKAVGTITITRSQYEIIDASKQGSLLEHFGEKIEVVGKISGKHFGATQHGSPYIFLNFGTYPLQTFTLVIWSEGITALTAKGMSPSSLVGKWVSVTGVIGSYGRKPQLIIELASQIQILADEAEANQRMKLKPISTVKASTSASAQIKKPPDKEADTFNSLYKDKPVYTPPKPVSTPQKTSSTYKPVTTNYGSFTQPSKQSSNSKSEDNSGCIIPIVFAVIGAIIIGSTSNGKLWFLGAIVGGLIGGWLSNSFKK